MAISKSVKALIWTNIISLLLFIILLFGIFYTVFLIELDQTINFFIPIIQNPLLTNFFIAVSFIFDVKSMIVISLILSVYWWIKLSKKDSLLFIFTMGLGGGAIYLLKELIQRPRPLNLLVTETGFAFPSGHGTIAVIFFGLLIYFSRKSKSRILKLNTLAISIFMILLICFARVYLNVHWFSDVLGGIAIGMFILTGCIILGQKFFGK